MSAWRIRSEALRRLRIAAMLDQAELSRLSGISVRAIRKLEAGDVGVTASTLDCLAKALGCKRTDIAIHVAPEDTAGWAAAIDRLAADSDGNARMRAAQRAAYHSLETMTISECYKDFEHG